MRMVGLGGLEPPIRRGLELSTKRLSVASSEQPPSMAGPPHGMGVARLTDLPAEWPRQHQMLGLPAQ